MMGREWVLVVMLIVLAGAGSQVLGAGQVPAGVAARAGGSSGGQAGPPERSTPSPVVIDPGHPSEVSGGANANGLREVDINWEVGQALAARLSANPHVRVLVNRQEKMRMMTNRERAEFANRAQAALVVRLHCDYAPGRSGFVIYYPDAQGTNAGRTGPSQLVIARSQMAAEAFHRGMARRLAGVFPDGGLKTDRSTAVGARNGGALIGSIWSEVPTLTVEMLYINNPLDAAFIRSEAGKQAMTEALAAGVEEALASLPRDLVGPASPKP